MREEEKDLVDMVEVYKVKKVGDFYQFVEPIATIINGKVMKVWENYAVEIKLIPKKEAGIYDKEL